MLQHHLLIPYKAAEVGSQSLDGADNDNQTLKAYINLTFCLGFCTITQQQMMDLSKRDFHHPYKPYDIQLQFMNALYDCVEDGKVGIFESPTG